MRWHSQAEASDPKTPKPRVHFSYSSNSWHLYLNSNNRYVEIQLNRRLLFLILIWQQSLSMLFPIRERIKGSQKLKHKSWSIATDELHHRNLCKYKLSNHHLSKLNLWHVFHRKASHSLPSRAGRHSNGALPFLDNLQIHTLLNGSKSLLAYTLRCLLSKEDLYLSRASPASVFIQVQGPPCQSFTRDWNMQKLQAPLGNQAI